MATKFYAVKVGKQPGIYRSWDACKAQIHGFKGALYKSFVTLAAAETYLSGDAIKQTDDLSKIYHIYVDGSYLNKRYSWGFAVYFNGELLYTKNGLGDNQEAAKLHNVAGEIAATIKAVEWALTAKLEKITIHHDYIGISEWAEKRWKTNNAITRQYAAFMEPHLAWVQFAKVSGHTGVAGNELADYLAKAALGIK